MDAFFRLHLDCYVVCENPKKKLKGNELLVLQISSKTKFPTFMTTIIFPSRHTLSLLINHMILTTCGLHKSLCVDYAHGIPIYILQLDFQKRFPE